MPKLSEKEVFKTIIDNDEHECISSSEWDDYILNYSDACWKAERIDRQYKSAMSRRNDYLCDLESHIYRGACTVVRYKDSYLVGNMNDGVFTVSHFAPKNMKEGVEMMKFFALGYFKIVFAVPFFLARMAHKLGFEWVTSTHQIFAGKSCLKHVFVNKYMTDKFVMLVEDLSKDFDTQVNIVNLP